MDLTIQELENIEYKDAFSFEKLKESMEYDSSVDSKACCFVCGNELENMSIGFNAQEQLYRYECSNCNVIYVIHETSEFSETVFLQGEERNWPVYLAETFDFPFSAKVEEDDGRAFFNPDYEGPSIYDIVKVLDVHYAYNYGVTAEVQKGDRVYSIALCFLLGLDDHNYKELENYKRWRDSHWVSDFWVDLLRANEDE